MDKQKSHAFGKDCYLLGKDRNGDYIWLEAASWDCGWYWGFGYVETYTYPRRPDLSRDIQSHTHIDCLLWKQGGHGYLHHLNQIMSESVLTERESWEFSDLMKSFYTLKETVEVVGRGYSHLTVSGRVDACVDVDMVKKINEEMIPAIFERVYKLLSPSEAIEAA